MSSITSSVSSTSRYHPIKTLGSGAFGTVYLCQVQRGTASTSAHSEDDDLQSEPQIVALKETFQDMKYKNREAEVLRLLKHPGIVKIFDIFYTKKRKSGRSKPATYLNIAMEYFPGTLHDLIERTSRKPRAQSRLSYQDIKWYTLQLFRTCGYLETLSLCHRDIKPQNILVDHSQKLIKMCDFGSAKKLLDSESNKHYICSRFYRAPELLCQSTHYSCSVDLWSTGCCMGEMYLAQPLFNGQNTKNQLHLIRNVLGEVPEHYPSKSRTDYAKRRGIASLQQWRKTLRIKENARRLSHPSASSGGAQDHDLRFIRGILQYNPDQRFTLKQTLAHPYFADLVWPTKEDRLAMQQNGYSDIQWTPHEVAIIKTIRNDKKQ